MKPEQRRDELLQGLRNTGSEVVYIAINQVAEVLGIEKAIELHNEGTLVETNEATRIRRRGDGTREVARTLVGGMAEFDREPLLEALEAHQAPATSTQEEGQQQETQKGEVVQTDALADPNSGKESFIFKPKE